MLDARLFIGWNWGGHWAWRVKRWKPSEYCLLHWLPRWWGRQLQYPHWLGRKQKVKWVHSSNPVVEVWTWIQSILNSIRPWCEITWSYSQHILSVLRHAFLPVPFLIHNYNIIQSEIFSHMVLVFYLVVTQIPNSEGSPSRTWLNDPPGIVYTSLTLFINHEFDRLLAWTYQIS